VILAETMPASLRGAEGETRMGTLQVSTPAGTQKPLADLGAGFNLEEHGEEMYKHYIALALERAGGVQVKAAEMLGMSFRSFRYYAKKFKLR
jgi:transcriptional regulator with GAF, ATPase, and Fis domain